MKSSLGELFVRTAASPSFRLRRKIEQDDGVEQDLEENKMETKSRYEVIADLEKQKRSLIVERDSFEHQLKDKEKEIKQLKRDLEDSEEELGDFKKSIDDRKKTIGELITSVDESLKRFENINSKSQKK